MKAVKWIVLGVVVLVVVVVAVVVLRIDSIIRYTVEDQSTKQLDVQTQLAGADFSIFGGQLGLEDYRIGSPQGFAAPAMFSVDDLNVDVSYGQLRQDPVRIKSIAIEQPTLVIEYSAEAKRFNFQALMDNLSKTPTDPEPTTGGASEPVRLIIDDLRVNRATVALRLGDLLKHPLLAAVKLDDLKVKDEYRLTLPDLAIANIGTGEGAQNGAAIKDVVAQVVTTMTSKFADSPDLPAEVRAVLQGDLKQAIAALRPELEAAVQKQVDRAVQQVSKEIGGPAGEAVQDVINATTQPDADSGKAIEQGVQKGIGELLGGDRKEKRKDERPE